MAETADTVLQALTDYKVELEAKFETLEDKLQQIIDEQIITLRDEFDGSITRLTTRLEGTMAELMETVNASSANLNRKLETLVDSTSPLPRRMVMKEDLSLQESGDDAEDEGKSDINDGLSHSSKPKGESKSDINDGLSHSSKPKEWLKFSLKNYTASATDSTWVEFLARFDMCCIFNEVPSISKTAVLGFYLAGIPRIYYNEVMSEDKTVSFKKLAERMKNKLEASRGTDQAVLEISTTRQGKDETVKEYYERFRKVVATGGTPLADPFVSLHFRMNLREGIRENMIAVADRSIDEMVKTACSIETSKLALWVVGGSNAKRSDSMGYDAPPQNKHFNENQNRRTVRSSDNQCFGCGGDHFRHDCPEAKPSNGGRNPQRTTPNSDDYEPQNSVQYPSGQNQGYNHWQFNDNKTHDHFQNYSWTPPPPQNQFYSGEHSNPPPQYPREGMNTSYQGRTPRYIPPKPRPPREPDDNCALFDCANIDEVHVVEIEDLSLDTNCEYYEMSNNCGAYSFGVGEMIDELSYLKDIPCMPEPVDDQSNEATVVTRPMPRTHINRSHYITALLART